MHRKKLKPKVASPSSAIALRHSANDDNASNADLHCLLPPREPQNPTSTSITPPPTPVVCLKKNTLLRAQLSPGSLLPPQPDLPASPRVHAVDIWNPTQPRLESQVEHKRGISHEVSARTTKRRPNHTLTSLAHRHHVILQPRQRSLAPRTTKLRPHDQNTQHTRCPLHLLPSPILRLDRGDECEHQRRYLEPAPRRLLTPIGKSMAGGATVDQEHAHLPIVHHRRRR